MYPGHRSLFCTQIGGALGWRLPRLAGQITVNNTDRRVATLPHIRRCTPLVPPEAATTTSLSPERGGTWWEAREETEVEEGVTEC